MLPVIHNIVCEICLCSARSKTFISLKFSRSINRVKLSNETNVWVSVSVRVIRNPTGLDTSVERQWKNKRVISTPTLYYFRAGICRGHSRHLVSSDPLMMEADRLLQTLVSLEHLSRLMAREDFIKFSLLESLKSHFMSFTALWELVSLSRYQSLVWNESLKA
jgi:hypothetical protein